MLVATDFQNVADTAAVHAFESNQQTPVVEEFENVISASFTLPGDHEDVAEWLYKELKAAKVRVLARATYPPIGKRAERHGHALLLEGEDRETIALLLENAAYNSKELTETGRTYWRTWSDLERDGLWDRSVLGGPTSEFDSRQWAIGEVLLTLPPSIYETLKGFPFAWSLSEEPAPDRGRVLHLPSRLADESIELVSGIVAYSLCRLMSDADRESAIAAIRSWGYELEAAVLEERLCKQPDFLR